MRAIRGEPTREESERNEKLIDVVDAMTRDVVKDFQDPQSRAMEEWLSLEDLKNLTDFATRDSGVSKEEAWSALQSEYPEYLRPSLQKKFQIYRLRQRVSLVIIV